MLSGKLSRKRRGYIGLMRALMYTCATLTCALVLFLIAYVLIKGVPNISWELLSTSPSYLTERIGILPDILNTVYIVIATLLVVLPLGVGAAIYLTEYAKNKKVVAAIEYAAETLSGIPSIIYGLVGMLFFCQFLGMRTSLLAGAMTLVIMNLPTIMRTTQESLKTVPQSYREGAFGLGAGKWRVIRTVVLPGCVDGIITGCILSVGAHPRRIGGAFIHRGFCPYPEWYCRGADKRRRDADRGTLCLRQGAGRVWRCVCGRGHTDGTDDDDQSCRDAYPVVL
jgi:phosphate transport system permease protein